jgi:uncharacterized protein (TIGR03437 family)
MRSAIILFLFSFAAISASAQVTLGTSNQNVTFTGIGNNVLGEGQSTVTWGNCVYANGTTTCTVSGPFTGLANGGTYNFVLTYPGNGPSPLTAISNAPGSIYTYFSLSAGTFTSTLTETNGPTIQFYNLSFQYFFVTNSVCAPASIACNVAQVGATPGSTITGPVYGTWTTMPVIRTSQGVITAGSFGAFSAIAPGTWIEIYGTNLATTPTGSWANLFTGNNAPTAVSGTTVTVGGIPAFIDYVSPGQVNAQVPSGVATGVQPVVVTNGSQYVVALISGTLTYVFPNSITGVATTRVKPGQSITLYGVGFGPQTPNTPAGQIVTQTNALPSFTASFGGVPATVTYAGLAPSYVGLYQFNITVPNIAASDTVPFTFSVNGNTGAQTMVIPVAN